MVILLCIENIWQIWENFPGQHRVHHFFSQESFQILQKYLQM